LRTLRSYKFVEIRKLTQSKVGWGERSEPQQLIMDVVLTANNPGQHVMAMLGFATLTPTYTRAMGIRL
jgi:hypothetical protein